MAGNGHTHLEAALPSAIRVAVRPMGLLGLVIAVGTFLRVWQFGEIPAGLNVDEAQIGVETISLLMTGRDRWGEAYPIYFSAWGSGLNALYAYLSLPFVGALGLEVWSIRIVSLLHGLLLLPLTYIAVARTFSVRVALVATALVAVLPWQVMASRWALESSILPFWALLGVLAVHTGFTSANPVSRIVSLIPWSVAVYAYSAFVIPLPFLLALILFLNWRSVVLRKYSWALGGLAALVVLLPMILFFARNKLGANLDSIDGLLPFSVPLFPSLRSDAIGLLSVWSLIYNGLYLFSGLFSPAIEHQHYTLQPMSPVLPFFSLLGLAAAVRDGWDRRRVDLISLSLACSAIPLLLLTMNTTRLNAFILFAIIAAAYGIVRLHEHLADRRLRRAFAAIMMLFVCAYSGFASLLYFRYYNDDIVRSSFHPGLPAALRAAMGSAEPQDDILLVETSELPYIYLLFFEPELIPSFQDSAVRSVTSYGTYRVERYERFVFFDRAVVAGEVARPSLAATYVFAAPADLVPCEGYVSLWSDRDWIAGRCTDDGGAID